MQQIPLYTDMMIISESVISQPFVNEMPVFLQTLYSRFLAQIPPLTMLLPACKLAFSASDLCKLMEASPAQCAGVNTQVPLMKRHHVRASTLY